MPTSTKNQKEIKRNSLLRHASLPKDTRAVILSYIQNKEILEFLVSACKALNISLLTDFASQESVYIEWADAFIADVLNKELPISTLLKNQVVPIIPLEEDVKKNFSEFNPMKFEGNAFLFEQKTKYHVFEKLVRYVENIRYAGDKRTLLQNIEKSEYKI